MILPCTYRRATRLLASVAFAAMTVHGAQAQDIPTPAAEDQAIGPKEIVVTARRIAENIQEVPVAVTALQGDDLERFVVNTIQDLGKLAPGLAPGACSGSRNDCSPVIRGQGTSFGTNAPSVVNYFAEVPNFQVSYYDLENLQVIKGPQGTLFGETATGGVLLYTPKKPGNEFEGYAKVSAGTFDLVELEGAVGGPLVRDVLSVRFAGQYRSRKGFTTAIPSYKTGSTRFDNVDNAQWRASVLFTPTDNFENYTMYAGSVTKSHGNSSPLYYTDPRYMSPSVRDIVLSNNFAFGTAFEWVAGYAPPAGLTYGQIINAGQLEQLAAGPRTTFNNYERGRKSIFHGIVNTTNWEVLDNLTIKNVFGLHWTKAKGPTLDVDGFDFSLVDTRATWVPGTTNVNTGEYAYSGGWSARTWTNETQLIGTLFADRLKWQTGFYYRRSGDRDWEANQGIISVFGFPQGDPAPASFCTAAGVANPCTTLSRTESTSYAAYGQATFAVTPTFNVTGGYRRTWDRRQSDAAATQPYFVTFKGIPFAVPISGREPIAGSRIIETIVPKSHEDTYTLSADWKVTDDVLLYLTHRKGYKGGGINNNALPDSPDRVFGAETLSDVEFGIKADWNLGGARGRTNVAFYRDDYSNIQRSQIVPGTATTITSNAADARIQGIELDASIYLSDWFELSGSLAYMDAKYKNWVETRVCATQWFRPQCTGISPLTPVVIDHAGGVITIGNQTVNFKPDSLQDSPRWTWALRPTFLLEPLTGQDIRLSANIYYRGRWTGNASNTSDTAGVTPLVQNTILGTVSEPFFRAPHTKIDLRADWDNVAGSNFRLAASVTNLTNKLINVSNGGGFTIGGTAPAIFEEPRMFFVEVGYKF